MTLDDFKNLALSLPQTVASPHFDRTAFKVVDKKIFATLDEKSETANLKLSPADQSVYCLIDAAVIYAVNNKWGLQGWTTFQFTRIDRQLMLEALQTAYNEVFKNKKK